MYCPACSTQTTDEINFCKQCGANLRTVRDALIGREPEPGERYDWSKTWVAEMFMSEEEKRRRRAALELSNSPIDLAAAELKRLNELKAGIITASVGIGVSIFLAILLGTIADNVAGRDPEGAAVLRHVWAAGIIPFMVGIALVINSVFVKGRFAQIRESFKDAESPSAKGLAKSTGELPALEAPPVPRASITEHTTNLLEDPETAPQRDAARRFVRE
jgi:hypothetical protein